MLPDGYLIGLSLLALAAGLVSGMRPARRDHTCPWWERWHHRRLRGADLEIQWPALVERADTLAEARVAWAVFVAQAGQEHWRCACGQIIGELFRTLTVTVED